MEFDRAMKILAIGLVLMKMAGVAVLSWPAVIVVALAMYFYQIAIVSFLTVCLVFVFMVSFVGFLLVEGWKEVKGRF